VQLWFGAAGLASPVGSGEGVAYFAHVGGFVFGLLLIRLFVRGKWHKPTVEPTPPGYQAGDPRREAHYPTRTTDDRALAADDSAHEADDRARTR
jgi:hypothetical protein